MWTRPLVYTPRSAERAQAAKSWGDYWDPHTDTYYHYNAKSGERREMGAAAAVQRRASLPPPGRAPPRQQAKPDGAAADEIRRLKMENERLRMADEHKEKLSSGRKKRPERRRKEKAVFMHGPADTPKHVLDSMGGKGGGED